MRRAPIVHTHTRARACARTQPHTRTRTACSKPSPPQEKCGFTATARSRGTARTPRRTCKRSVARNARSALRLRRHGALGNPRRSSRSGKLTRQRLNTHAPQRPGMCTGFRIVVLE
eukprot:gene16647-biopygen23288